MILLFNQDGEARGIYSEQIDLRAIGEMQMERASVIEFNPDRQAWEVKLPGDSITVLFQHESREECLKWEREYFEAQL